MFNFYSNDNEDDIINEVNKYLETLTNNTIINYQTLKQDEENKRLIENIIKSVKILKNALSILDCRTITNIGERISHYVVPENYDRDLGVHPRWYLIQLWRGRKFSI